MACGAGFLVAARIAPEAMSSNVYGQAAYDIDAETWAMGFVAAHMLVLYGIHINGRAAFSPALRVVGYLFLLAMFGYFIVSAMAAPDGMIVVIFGGLFFVPSILRYLRINLSDAVARVRHAARDF
jgi:hypothetical protein